MKRSTVIISLLVLVVGLALRFFFFSEKNNFEALDGEYDYIVVGSGSSGSVVASRLSESGRDRVLVLEAGFSDDKLEIKMPAAFAKLFRTHYDWNYSTEPQEYVNKREMYWPRGKTVGGCSSMNAMIYCRGTERDYNLWEKQGAEGWGWNNILKYFLRAEHNEAYADADKLHGTDGPLIVSNLAHTHKLTEILINASVAAGVQAGTGNLNDGKEGVAALQVFQKQGRRWSAADAYLKPALASRNNIKLVTRALVTRVVFDQTGTPKAVGVEVLLPSGERKIVRAKKEVILSAGSINTPQLLMLSGVGPSEHLKSLGIEVVKDLPGVGQNLQDHVFFPIARRVTQKISLHSEETLLNVANFLLFGKGPLTSNYAEFGGFIHLRNREYPDLQLLGGPLWYVNHGLVYPGGDGVTAAPVLLQPKSRGFIKLRSTNPMDKPIIDPRYFSEDDDLQYLVEAAHFTRKILQKAREMHPDLIADEVYPGEQVQTDEQWREHIKNELMTVYHPVGTAKMGNPEQDPSVVVDSRLKVVGIQSLRVVDLSVAPTIPACNTHFPAVVIGEKAADIIREDDNNNNNNQ